ncbi:hypothetical protein GCM10007981_16310 [Thermocladium modestius]|uniref:Uncharacterized protein n=1 Tax=Thermocladium modestius TaxID=62609 RepID=A0A830GVF6_9CREN|nr:hypothetical protein [Thermocladium modestius]GGP21997.1 hypothetical protein GCM10007981_16310 [Thermocladium modestius]
MLDDLIRELKGRVAVMGEAWLPLIAPAVYITGDYDLAVTKYLREFEVVGSEVVIAAGSRLPFRQRAFDEFIAHAAFNNPATVTAEVGEALKACNELIIIGIQSDRGWVSTPLFNSSLVVIRNKLLELAREHGSNVVEFPEYFVIKIRN